MEGDGLCLHLALFHINLVTSENDWDLLADTDKVTCRNVRILQGARGSLSLTVPVGDILVCNARSDIEHDNTALAVDVVSISQTTEFLLTSGVPDIELNLTVILCRSEQKAV